MLAKQDAIKLLEGLDYLTQNKAPSWKGMPRGAFLYSLTQIFLTEDIQGIRTYLDRIVSGDISPNIIPQDIYQKAESRGISKEGLEKQVQKQKSYLQSWIKSIAQKPTAEQTTETQVKAAEATAKIERDSSEKKQTETLSKQPQAKTPFKKEVTTPEDITTEKEEILIPVTGEEKNVPSDQKIENIQVKFDSKQNAPTDQILPNSQPFLAASEKLQQSEYIDLNSSFHLISKGISSTQLESAIQNLPDGNEKKSLFRVSYTMKEIERIFPDEISRFKNYLSVENLEVKISQVDFVPSQNNILLRSNLNPYGGYTAIDNPSGTSGLLDFAKDKVLDKASDAITSKVKTKLGGKLAKGTIGKAVKTVGQKITKKALGKLISSIGAKIGAALGSFAPIIGNIIGAIVGAIAGWIIQKLIPFIQKIKDYAKKAAKGIVATAATIIIFPFILFISAISTPFIIILISLPISIALIMFIINSGAYITPPKASTIAAQETISPYIDITKTANPAGPFDNNDLPLTIEYTVEIKAKKSGLTNIQIKDSCSVTKRGSSPSCPNIDSGTNIPSGDEIPENITTSQPFSFKYKRTFAKGTYSDSLVVDTISVIADVPEQKGAESAASAIIKIGNPPEQCPSGWPVSGSWPLTQGPGGSYSHSSIQAIDIGVPTGTPVKATHSGIATVVYTSNAYRPIYVDIVSTCNGTQFTSRYAHLVSASTTSGKSIIKGQTIGYSGSDGNGSHLHYEFRGLKMNVPYIPKAVPANCKNCMNTN